MRTWARLAALAVVVAMAPGAGASEPPGVSRLYVAERTTAGPTLLAVSAGFGYDTLDGPAEGFLGVVAVRDGDDGIVATHSGFIVSGSTADVPWVYVNGDRVVGCGGSIVDPDEVCRRIASFGGTGIGYARSDDGGPDDPTRIFFAVHGSDGGVQLGANTVGWRLRALAPAFSFVHGSQAEAAGVQTGVFGGGAEAFLSAVTVGGEHGSVAVGQPPCSVGAGVTQLFGGETEPLHVCRVHSGGVTDFAREATTWRLEGAAVGASPLSLGLTRLVVVDLPPPCDDDEDDDDEDCDEV